MSFRFFSTLIQKQRAYLKQNTHRHPFLWNRGRREHCYLLQWFFNCTQIRVFPAHRNDGCKETFCSQISFSFNTSSNCKRVLLNQWDVSTCWSSFWRCKVSLVRSSLTKGLWRLVGTCTLAIKLPVSSCIPHLLLDRGEDKTRTSCRQELYRTTCIFGVGSCVQPAR